MGGICVPQSQLYKHYPHSAQRMKTNKGLFPWDRCWFPASESRVAFSFSDCFCWGQREFVTDCISSCALGALLGLIKLWYPVLCMLGFRVVQSRFENSWFTPWLGTKGGDLVAGTSCGDSFMIRRSSVLLLTRFQSTKILSLSLYFFCLSTDKWLIS